MWRWFVVGISVLLTLVPASAAQEKIFRAGAYAIDITPTKFPISVNGGMADRQASAAHDRLHARCLVLDDGRNRLAFVVCDSCMIPRDITDAAKALAQKATGIPPAQILIAATHTHTTPTVAGVFQSEPDADYQKYLTEKIAAGIAEANQRLVAARVGWGVGSDPTQVFNRRWKMKPGSAALVDPFGKGTDQVRMNPGFLHEDRLEQAGPVDPAITLLAVQTRDGRPLALLANYSLHYVGGLPALSADYFGVYAERMKELVGGGPEFVGILANGTSGDINNVDFAHAAPARQNPGERIRLVVDSVAAASLKAYREIRFHDWVSLASALRELELGVRRPDAAELARARAILENAKRPLAKPAEVYARETVLLSHYPTKVKLLVQALRVGGLGIAADPCETFVEIGLELKKRSPLHPTCTIELANGYNGYLPTAAQHALGGYETWRARSSYLEVDAARIITATLVELLTEVAATK